MTFRTEDESTLATGLWAAVAALMVGLIVALVGKIVFDLSREARIDILLYVAGGTFVLEYFNDQVRDWLIDAAGKLVLVLLIIGGIGKVLCWNCELF